MVHFQISKTPPMHLAAHSLLENRPMIAFSKGSGLCSGSGIGSGIGSPDRIAEYFPSSGPARTRRGCPTLSRRACTHTHPLSHTYTCRHIQAAEIQFHINIAKENLMLKTFGMLECSKNVFHFVKVFFGSLTYNKIFWDGSINVILFF